MNQESFLRMEQAERLMMPLKIVKLNLGCGSKVLDGYINVDHPRSITHKDVAWDLNITPWPFESNSVDEVLMQDSLEHLTFPDEKINEVHRILKSGGIFRGGVPYAHSDGAVQCLEHRCFFTEKSFDYICGVSGYDAIGEAKFKMIYVRLTSAGNTTLTKLRNLIPFRNLLRHVLRNMYDEVEFKMTKL